MKNKKSLFFEIVRYGIIFGIAIALLFPLYFMIMNSFKSEGGFHLNKWAPSFSDVNFENYSIAFNAVKSYLVNSFYLAVLITFLILLISSITAYVFAVHEFPGKKVLFFAIIIVLMIPGILTFIPTYQIIRFLGLNDNHLAVIIPGVAGGQIFTIYVLRGFFEQIPRDITEAARIDGANDPQLILTVILPLAMPMLTTMGVLSIIGQWNNYMWPLVTLPSRELWTIPIGIRFLSEAGNIRTTVQYAAYTVVSIPLIVLFGFTMDKFVEGLSSGAIKG